MVELRKRKEAPPAPPTAAKKTKITTAKAKPAAAPKAGPTSTSATTAPATGAPQAGSKIEVSAFGGEVATHDGETTTLAKLLAESKGGVVLFTYPKASTPGCTTQACLFRDSYTPLTATGFSIYGLSSDSPKSNTTFKTKQNLPYTLLCDPKQTLIKAIGMGKAGGKTQRGVFVVDKDGKVLAAEPGGPAPTVEVVRKLIVGADKEEVPDKSKV